MAGQKILTYSPANPGGVTEVATIQTSAGAGSSGLIPALNTSGVLDSSFLPPGIGPDTQTVLTSEAIAAGAFVNIWNNAGAFALRNADNTVSGKEAHGFCLTAFASGVTATVYFNGNNTAVTGKTPGKWFLGTVGASVSTPPSSSGNVVQLLGLAPNATTINFTLNPPIILA